MSSLAPAATVKVPLTPAELWTVHRVLVHRIDRARRRDAIDEPPPPEVSSVLGKIERGDPWFTVPELRCLRAELRRTLERPAESPPDRATVERLVRRIGAVLAGGSALGR